MRLFVMACMLMVCAFNSSYSQTSETTELPFRQIPDYPEDYGPGSVMARFIDGLGFRYYWATEKLGEKDLAYKPSEKGRNVLETIEHISSLSTMILNVAKQQPITSANKTEDNDYTALRAKTLSNLYLARQLFAGMTEEKFSKMNITFSRKGKEDVFPIWHLENGPIADAIWHTGQIVLMRRASGNPFDSKANVFSGRHID